MRGELESEGSPGEGGCKFLVSAPELPAHEEAKRQLNGWAGSFLTLKLETESLCLCDLGHTGKNAQDFPTVRQLPSGCMSQQRRTKAPQSAWHWREDDEAEKADLLEETQDNLNFKN